MDMQPLVDALDRMARQWNSLAAALPVQLEVPWGGGRLVCRLYAVESLACQWDELAVTADPPLAVGGDALAKRGHALAERLRYLEEPVGLVEVDRQAGEALLRSVPPGREAGVRRYYELLAGAASVRVVRIEVAAGGSRQRIPATTTRPILARLAGDLAGWFAPQ